MKLVRFRGTWVNPKNLLVLRRMQRHGIVNPVYTLRAAHKAGLRIELACALLDQESDGGHNIFGHDPTIFSGAGQVTKWKYLAYKAARGPSGRGGMQGVGPMQLTWYSYQDAADRAGGCWKPYCNMLIGFHHTAELIRAHGLAAGLAAYNGSGAQADAYSRSVRDRLKVWEARL